MLAVENLACSYGAGYALHDVSLTVGEGEVVALIGPNGAGKTTLLRAVSGALKPVRGSIRLRGQDITGKPVHMVAGLGVSHVPEGRRVFPLLTVMENLEMGGYRWRGGRELSRRIGGILDSFPILKERKHQIGKTLSGGEQQILSIARGLMSDPTLLLLDEPSLGLAPLMVKQIRELITEINADRGTSILLAEQNARLALSVASRCYVLEQGRVAFSGYTRELKEDPALEQAYLGF